MKTIDWTKPLPPVSDHSYRIRVFEIAGDLVSGTLVDEKHRQVGMLTWVRSTGVLLAADKTFPFSAWCAENIPEVAPAGKDVDAIRLNFNCYTGAMERFSREDVRTLLQAIDDRDEVLEDHKRLVREIDVALNGEKGAAPQASLVDILAQLKNPARDIINVRARPECEMDACPNPPACAKQCQNVNKLFSR